MVHEKPDVHLNGTSKAELLRQYNEVVTALELVLDALRDAAPHSRDYYLQDSGNYAYERACREHMERHAAIVEVHHDIVALRDHVAEQ